MVIEGRETVLLVGWEGTLTYDSNCRPGEMPAQLKTLTDTYLVAASESLRRVLRNRQIEIGGAPVPLEQLLPALEQRIAAVCGVAFAICGDDRSAAAWVGADRLAQTLVESWAAGTGMFLERLRADTVRLARWLGLRTAPAITSLTTAASDVHGREGAVLRLQFDCGRTIFYKPRPVTGEMFWAELNTALADFDEQSSVMAASVLAGGAGGPGTRRISKYGWMNGLERAECEGKTHWRKAGTLLCLAQHTGLSDLHRSNLLATRQGPAVLDAECLGDVIFWPDHGVNSQGSMEQGLIATGLLPHPPGAGEFTPPDVSGLFGGAAAVPGILLPCWSEMGDGISGVSLLPARLIDQGNLLPQSSQPLLHLPELLSGYLRAAEALVAIRPALLREGGWIDRMAAQHSPRVVHRNTLSYGRAMSLSLTAEALGSEEIRRKLLRSAIEAAPSLLSESVTKQLMDVEVEALLRLCVPCFHLERGTRDLSHNHHRVLAREVSPVRVADAVRGRLERLRVTDLEQPLKEALTSILFHARRVDGGASR